jgi:hypothetical protein
VDEARRGRKSDFGVWLKGRGRDRCCVKGRRWPIKHLELLTLHIQSRLLRAITCALQGNLILMNSLFGESELLVHPSKSPPANSCAVRAGIFRHCILQTLERTKSTSTYLFLSDICTRGSQRPRGLSCLLF